MDIFTINNILYLSILLVIVMAIFLIFTTYKYFKDYKTKLMNNNVVYDLPEEFKESQEEYIMPKWIKAVLISVAVLILAAICFFAFTKIKNYYDNKPKVLPNGTVVYDFSTQRQAKASKILYEYILSDMNNLSLYNYKQIDFTKNPEIAKNRFDIEVNKVYAICIDLNDDGENEIIGYVDAFLYGGAERNEIFILQKKNDKYKNIVKYPVYFFSNKIIVISKKTNNYKDILLAIRDDNTKKNVLLNYYNKYYYTDEDYNKLKEIIENDKFYTNKEKHNILKEQKQSANKILYKYALENDLKMNEREAEDFAKFTFDHVSAIEVDLNNDGRNEILGVIKAGYYSGRLYPCLLILEKYRGSYRKISLCNDINIEDDIYFKRNNETGYYDIIASRYDKPVIIKYHRICFEENIPCYY